MLSPEEAARLVPGYQIPDKEYLLAESLDDLVAINEAALAEKCPEITKVGLKLIPDAFDAPSLTGVRVSELTAMAPTIRSLRAITVRGCFVRGDLTGLHGRELGRFFRACYENAKQMTVIIPCAMPYLCVEGGLAALAKNEAEHPETLSEVLRAAEIVAMQNETAFYAKLLIT